MTWMGAAVKASALADMTGEELQALGNRMADQIIAARQTGQGDESKTDACLAPLASSPGPRRIDTVDTSPHPDGEPFGSAAGAASGPPQGA